MTVTSHARSDTRLPDPNFVHPELIAPETRSAKAARYVAAALRTDNPDSEEDVEWRPTERR